MSPQKTVVVLGASYGGSRAAQVLSQSLPQGWRVVLIDRNTHMNHLYILPRLASLPQHAHKAFIPYTHLFGKPEESQRHLFLHAQITSLSAHSLTLSKSFPEYGIGTKGEPATLEFEYAVYALGSHLPAPINLWGPASANDTHITHEGTKAQGVEWLKRFRAVLDKTRSVLIVGGGALGIQFATDIKEVFPNTRVTLLHSREQLLPRFDIAMHEEILSTVTGMGIDLILGERLDLSSPAKETLNEDGTRERLVRTQSGREIQAELVLLCTGQTPNTALMGSLLPDSIVQEGSSKGSIKVTRTLQVGVPQPQPSSVPSENLASEEDEEEQDEELLVPHPHIFAIGDAADAFGAINAGHTAFYQANVAAGNILKLISHSAEGASEDVELEEYFPGEPGIKLSLGLRKAAYQVQGVVGTKTDVTEDLDAGYMWKMYGFEPTEETMRL